MVKFNAESKVTRLCFAIYTYFTLLCCPTPPVHFVLIYFIIISILYFLFIFAVLLLLEITWEQNRQTLEQNRQIQIHLDFFFKKGFRICVLSCMHESTNTSEMMHRDAYRMCVVIDDLLVTLINSSNNLMNFYEGPGWGWGCGVKTPCPYLHCLG